MFVAAIYYPDFLKYLEYVWSLGFDPGLLVAICFFLFYP